MLRAYLFTYSNTTYTELGTSMADAYRTLCKRYPCLRTSNLINAEIL